MVSVPEVVCTSKVLQKHQHCRNMAKSSCPQFLIMINLHLDKQTRTTSKQLSELKGDERQRETELLLRVQNNPYIRHISMRSNCT